MIGRQFSDSASALASVPFYTVPINTYITSILLDTGLAIIVLSLAALITSFFSLRARIIMLTLLGFLAVTLSGYSWMLAFSTSVMTGIEYSLVMICAIILALVIYALEARMVVNLSEF